MERQGDIRCRGEEKQKTDGKKHVKEFRPKQFEDRDSLLTIMYRQDDSSIVFHVFCGIFILFFLRALIDDIFVHKIPLYHTWLIWWNFSYFIPTMFVWSLMFLSTLVLYAAFKLWAHQPAKGESTAQIKLFAACYTAYQIALFYYPLKFLFDWDLNCACSFIITCETTRIAMKMHSFVRENWQRAMRMRNGETDATFPTIQQFLYYQFCPSFIYRDEYPLRSTRCMKTAGIYFLQCLMCIEMVNLAFTQYVFPWLSSQDYRSLTVSSIVLSLFAGIVPGITCMLCLFYGLLHCWLNLFSELMYFGDRRFYANWWQSENMAVYYRNWNLVVHDWLYAYIFRDVSNLVGGKRGQQLGQLAVFFISATFHEYWFGVAFRCFYPVMFILYFICGGTFFSISRFIRNKSVWNTALWFNLLIGTGMFISFYGQEWYARRSHCLPYSNSVVDALLPRHWACY